MLRFLSDEKYIKIYWSVKVSKIKKLTVTLSDGYKASYVVDKDGFTWNPPSDLSPEKQRAYWDELYAKVQNKGKKH